MSDTALPRPLRGIVPPMVTPLKNRDELDAAGLERLVEHVLEGGVSGLFILGTTGEAPSLSYRLRKELIERVCRQVRARVPVLVGITDTSFTESVLLAAFAAECGAQAAVLSTPYYFPAGQPELLEYIEHIVPEIPLPVLLYNIPSHTKLSFELETVRRALDIPGVVGIKDSSGSMVYFHHLMLMLQDRPDWTLLMGTEQLLADAVLLGGHGGVTGGANLDPKLYVDLYNAAVDRDMERIVKLQARVMKVDATINRIGRHRSAPVKGLKCALSCLGICDDFMAEPFHRFRPPEREKVLQYLQEMGLA